jgi:hypothetical protein
MQRGFLARHAVEPRREAGAQRCERFAPPCEARLQIPDLTKTEAGLDVREPEIGSDAAIEVGLPPLEIALIDECGGAFKDVTVAGHQSAALSGGQDFRNAEGINAHGPERSRRVTEVTMSERASSVLNHWNAATCALGCGSDHILPGVSGEIDKANCLRPG